jgi:2-dehydropantoate 2-reductase
MRIAVFGAGGVGGYFGGRLAQAGEELVFIARGEHLRLLQSQGLRVDSIKGDFLVKPVQATDDLRRVGQVDFVLLAVKGWQVPEAALAMQPMVGAHTCVVPLGNGVEAPSQLKAILGAGPVLGGLCRISAFLAEPGHIRHVGLEPSVAFGELDNRLTSRVEALRQAFERTGVKVSVPPDIQIAMWEKFVFIVAISGVGAVARAPAGVLRSLPETRLLLEQAVAEAVAMGRAWRIALPEDAVARTMATIDSLEPGVIASMQRDIVEGRPSELGTQNGAVVRMGLELGIPTPTHSFIYHSLLPQELAARAAYGPGL